MLQENRCETIADYENLRDIPYGERCTEYSRDFGMYVFKLDCRPEAINERHAEARSYLEGRVLANGKKLTAVFAKTVAGNIQDRSLFQLSAEAEMLRLFMETDAAEKKLGIQIGEDTYMLLRQESGLPAELLTLPFGLCEERYMERLDFTRNRWLRQLTLWNEQGYKEQIKRMAEEAEGKIGPRQESFPYAKEIKKRMENCGKLFREQRMEGYDFRETDLQGAIFFRCKLANSNFSGVNLENAVFVHCDLTGCLWYGAMLNNSTAYGRGELLRLSERIRVDIVEEGRL